MNRITKYKAAKVIIAALAITMISACGKEKTQNNRVIFTPDVENRPTTEVSTNETVPMGEFEEFLPGEENWGEAIKESTVAVNEMTGVKAVEEAVKNALGDNYWPDTQMDNLDNVFVSSEMYEEFAYNKSSGDKGDEIIIIKAKEGKADEVREKLNQYRDSKINDYNVNENDIIKIQCSQVVNVGNYVIFVQLGADEGTKAADSKKTASDDVQVQAEMEAIDAQNNLAIESIKNVLVK